MTRFAVKEAVHKLESYKESAMRHVGATIFALALMSGPTWAQESELFVKSNGEIKNAAGQVLGKMPFGEPWTYDPKQVFSSYDGSGCSLSGTYILLYARNKGPLEISEMLRVYEAKPTELAKRVLGHAACDPGSHIDITVNQAISLLNDSKFDGTTEISADILDKIQKENGS